MANEITKTPQRPKFSVAIQQDMYKNLINNTLGDPKRAARFIASISSAVAINPALQECDPGTILSAALVGESLNLDPSPQLGDYYLVPYNDTKTGRKVAQFQIGYKGYIQLAIRSGQYKMLNVFAIKKDEIVRDFDPITETIEIRFLKSDVRKHAPTVGYCATFELVNGFRKMLYWSKEEMEEHALAYSKGYKAGKGYTFWEKDFDSMANKTMLRQILSKWGVRSRELIQAYQNDAAVIDEGGRVEYVDSDENTQSKTANLLENIKNEDAKNGSEQQ